VLLELNKLTVFFVLFSTHNIGVKQIQVLKETNHRYHMEEMMVKLKIEQMKKLTDNECDKVYSLAQQREELTLVGTRFSYLTHKIIA